MNNPHYKNSASDRKRKFLMFELSSTSANFWFDMSNLALALGAALALAGTIGVIKIGAIREQFSDERISANELKAAQANERAASAELRAAEAHNNAAMLEAQLLRERRLTANERWRLERLERAVLPRNIAPEVRESLVFALRGKAKSLCMLVIAESEAVIFAQHLAALFNEAGIATQISLLSKDSKQEGVAMWTVDSVGSEIARVLWQVARIGGGQISGQRPIGLEALPLDKNCLVVGRNDAALMPASGQPGEGIDERGNPVPAP
jgi:hypothetical protein